MINACSVESTKAIIIHLLSRTMIVKSLTHEEIVGLRRKTSVLEETEKVCELSMDVAADFQGSLQFQQDGLRQENVTGPAKKGKRGEGKLK